MVRCVLCGGDYNYPIEIKKYGRYHICKHCLRTLDRCNVCGKKRHRLNMHGVCEDCAGFDTFDWLAEPTLNQMARARLRPRFIVDDEVVIQEAVANHTKRETLECSECGKLHFKDESYDIPDHEGLCYRCYRQYSKCYVCGKYHKNVEEGWCMDCRHKEGQGMEFNWRYRPKNFFPHGDDTGIMFGVENEVQLNREVNKLEWLNQFAKDYHPTVAYTMYDGTINYGTEVVFHPHSFKALKRLDVSKHLVGVRKHPNTGMHVHINRGAFVSKVHLYKFMRFISENRNLITYIAERNQTERGWVFTHKELLIRKAQGRRVDRNKYVDVNLKHENTVELRIFKGVTTTSGFYKNVEFCHALLMYSKHHNAKDMTDAGKFAWYVREHGSMYENLYKRLEKGGYYGED